MIKRLGLRRGQTAALILNGIIMPGTMIGDRVAPPMWGDAMTTEEKSTWTDEQLVEHLRKWAIELSTCRLDAVKQPDHGSGAVSGASHSRGAGCGCIAKVAAAGGGREPCRTMGSGVLCL